MRFFFAFILEHSRFAFCCRERKYLHSSATWNESKTTALKLCVRDVFGRANSVFFSFVQLAVSMYRPNNAQRIKLQSKSNYKTENIPRLRRFKRKDDRSIVFGTLFALNSISCLRNFHFHFRVCFRLKWKFLLNFRLRSRDLLHPFEH